MSFGTSLITVKNTLVTLLSARPGLNGVTITYGYPAAGPLSENIWFGGAESLDESPIMNDPALDEDYRLQCRLQVLKTQGETQQAADTRCVELLVELQKLLSQNPSLGLSVIEYAQLETWVQSSGPLETGSGNGSAFDVKIRVKAILQ